jgi:hypothetical protein
MRTALTLRTMMFSFGTLQASGQTNAAQHRLGNDSDLVDGFWASLYLNLGHSKEKLGDMSASRENLRLARRSLEAVPEGRYKEIVRQGIDNVLTRIRQSEHSTR